MASQPRQAREAERKLSVQTLAIASVSSALAALIVSQFWKGGTAPAAAVTPVVITLISELLRKPTQAITSRVSTERTAISPEGAGAGAPAQKSEVAAGAPARDLEGSRPASEERPPLREDGEEPVPSDQRESRDAPISYHRAGSNGRPATEGRKIPWRIVATTAALAIVIGAAILTVPELVTGGSAGRTNGGTTLFGGGKDTANDTQDSQDDSQQQDGSEQDPKQSETDKQDSTTKQKTEPPDKATQKSTPAPQTKQKSTPAPQTKPAPAQP